MRCEDICCHGSAETNILRRRHGNIDREGNEGARHNKSQRVADLFILPRWCLPPLLRGQWSTLLLVITKMLIKMFPTAVRNTLVLFGPRWNNDSSREWMEGWRQDDSVNIYKRKVVFSFCLVFLNHWFSLSSILLGCRGRDSRHAALLKIFAASCRSQYWDFFQLITAAASPGGIIQSSSCKIPPHTHTHTYIYW